MKFKYLAFILLSFPIFIYSQETAIKTGTYLKEVFEKDGQSLNYRILYPNDFDKQKSYPLFLFLHGMGERGSQNEKQLTHGSQLFLDSLQKYPAIVIFPQCPETDYWANLYRPDEGGRKRKFTFHTNEDPNPSLGLVLALINELLEEEYIDQNRFYVSGLSMGAMGVWELLWRIPERIAAALPICGGGPPEMAHKMLNIPIWAFHGVDDSVVHPNLSWNMVRAIQMKGGKAKISLYPGVDHNSWDNAFADPEFLSWAFKHSK